ncbi:hypothetical protein LUZ63_020522 [Rhynchospora breviuscula]|uniref:AB hydrolase-1 domain-containing protein n=1 Tax=Rhynchospora breviuscula TaxID=2022672 RepID=A0A9Q0C0D1_9POAL|nr:hypothetical protein LUZ63_020522 [Rhynchospora breviuscula]
MSPQDVAALLEQLPDCRRKGTAQRPAWYVHDRLVARLEDRTTLTVRSTLARREELVREHPEVFGVPPRFERHEKVQVVLDHGAEEAVHAALRAAYDLQRRRGSARGGAAHREHRTQTPGGVEREAPGPGEDQPGGEPPEDEVHLEPARQLEEEPVRELQQHGVDHDREQPGRGERGEQAERHQQPAEELGQAGDPRQDLGEPEAVARQGAAREAVDAAAAEGAEHLLRPVADERRRQHQAQHQQSDVGGGSARRSGALAGTGLRRVHAPTLALRGAAEHHRPAEPVLTGAEEGDGTLLQVVEHEIEVPLDHADSGGPTVPLFARELVAPGGESRPHLVFLQGGPGGEPPRPHLSPLSPAWLARALQDFRVLLLDQRGTGRSAPLVDLETMTPQQQADHLALFRADSIVADAELLREALGIERWSLLGQSFGGFCTTTYLSHAPGALAAAYLTGGVPPVGDGPEVVYPRTYATMAARSRAHWERYPEDLPRFRRLLDLAAEGSLRLPDGEPVTPLRLRQVGHGLGMSYGTWDLHALLERDPRSPGFRLGLREAMAFGGSNPLYALLQEACYADGTVTGWAAARTLPEEMEGPTTFFGEHLFPATFADDASLAAYAEAAELLARREWPRLYDEDVLSRNEVPGAAAVYAHDAYVDRELSERTLAEVPGLEAWVTSEHEHDALRTSGADVLDRLLTMVPPR